MAFHPVISEVKDVDADGKPDVFRYRSEHPGARIERLCFDGGSVVWESEPLGALHGDESRLPVFDLRGNGRFSAQLRAEKAGPVKFLRHEAGAAIFEVRSGNYRFEVPMRSRGV